jgi:4-hydroxy-tetrahydrodipicolinate reductase
MSLNIALIGSGKMGKEIAQYAEVRGHRIISTFDIEHPLKSGAINKKIDVFIDFSIPTAVLPNLKEIAKSGKPVVIGTTGWYAQLDELKKLVEQAQIGVIYAANFSIGMNIFFRIVENASALFDKFEDYDPFIHEMHHRLKIDSPSGTALTLGEIILKKLNRKNQLLSEKCNGPISQNQLHVSSTRSGNIPGIHLVGFDSYADTIELRHTTRNRSGFAIGSLYAAEWIYGKKGLFNINDMLKDILK